MANQNRYADMKCKADKLEQRRSSERDVTTFGHGGGGGVMVVGGSVLLACLILSANVCSNCSRFP